MSMRILLLPVLSVLAGALAAASNAPAPVVLTPEAHAALAVETALVEEGAFEETAFALGQLQVRPERVAAVSSRVAGRVAVLRSYPGDTVSTGTVVAEIESRIPGAKDTLLPLVAPLSGVVTTLAVRLGDPVEPDRALLEVSDYAELLAVAQVPETVAARLQLGSRARLSVPAVGGSSREVVLERFGNEGDPVAGTVPAWFRVTNPSGRLLPGMRAEFALILQQKSGVMAVPKSAVLEESGVRYVYVKDFRLANAYLKTPVKIGLVNDQTVELLSGVFPADEVVSRGAHSLNLVGAGTVSLKEALDAAHGHAHAEDGSELTEAASAGGKAEESAAAHAHAHEDEPTSAWRWQVLAGVSALGWAATLLWRRRPTSPTTEE